MDLSARSNKTLSQTAIHDTGMELGKIVPARAAGLDPAEVGFLHIVPEQGGSQQTANADIFRVVPVRN